MTSSTASSSIYVIICIFLASNSPIVKCNTTVLSSSDRSAKASPQEKAFIESLLQIFDALISYKVQSNRQLYNVADIKDWGLDNKTQGIEVDQSNWPQFLDKIETISSKAFPKSLRGITLDRRMLKQLSQMLNVTLKTPVSFSCNEGNLGVKGHFVKLSDVAADTSCNGVVHSIIIQAAFYVYIDMNIELNSATGESAKVRKRPENDKDELKEVDKETNNVKPRSLDPQESPLALTGNDSFVCIMSPGWNVVGNRTIDLTKKNFTVPAAYPKAAPGKNIDVKGDDGNPGRPGESGGSFLALGLEFLGGELIVSSNGGPGGPGQDGGDEAVRNESISKQLEMKSVSCVQSNATYQDGTDILRSRKLKFEHFEKSYNFTNTSVYHYYIQSPVIEGVRVGTGGAGGRGGCGAVNVFPFGDDSNIRVSVTPGPNGTDGALGEKFVTKETEVLVKYTVIGSDDNHTCQWKLLQAFNYESRSYAPAKPVEPIPPTDAKNVSFFIETISAYEKFLMDDIMTDREFVISTQKDFFTGICLAERYKELKPDAAQLTDEQRKKNCRIIRN